MKTTTKVAFSAALILGALTSCDKENWTFGRTGISAINIGKVEATAPLTKAAAAPEVSQVTLEDGSVFTIEKTVEPYMAEPQTKANIKTAESLTSFTLDGYLDEAEIKKADGASAEDKANLKFISGNAVTKGADALWHTSGDCYWRNNITHYFWAYSGASGMSTSANSASFTKTADSDEDILVAFASKKWNEAMCNDHAGDNLDLNFKHALSAAKVKRGTVEYKQKDASGNITPAQEGRVKLHHINLLRMKEGSCAVDKDMNFTWTGLAKNGVTEIQEETETILSIPQNTAAFEVYYTDTIRTVTRPAIIKLDDNWEAGNLYSYTLNGTVTVPKVEKIIPGGGIDLGFHGNKDNRSEIVISTVDVTYSKELQFSWEGIPTTSGNHTMAFVYFAKDTININTLGAIAKGDKTDKEKFAERNEVVFMYDAKEPRVYKGTTNPEKPTDCTCSFTVPEELTGVVNVYFAYIGQSNSGSTAWTIKNIKLEVTKYR